MKPKKPIPWRRRSRPFWVQNEKLYKRVRQPDGSNVWEFKVTPDARKEVWIDMVVGNGFYRDDGVRT